MTTSLVEFYRRHKVSPVRQDIRDLRSHFERRESLYRHLGILPSFVRGRTVLEIGPGSGYNSLYTASLKPARYVLVEGNPSGVDGIKALGSQYPELAAGTEVVPALLEDYGGTETFDFVLCEGMLPLAGVPNPGDLLRQVARFVAPGGVLVITCVDNVSYCPETLRRLFAQLLIDPTAELDAQVRMLTPIFSRHLALLPGVSRRADDWVLDNLLNPASIGKLLPIPEAVSILADEFDMYSSSPHFVTDWRWSKSIVGANRDFNRRTIDQYWLNMHNFFDHSRVLAPRSETANRRLDELCGRARDSIRAFEESRHLSSLTDIQAALEEIVRSTGDFSPPLAEALAEARALLRPQPDPQALAESKKFGSLFGRGQQYLSFYRRGHAVPLAAGG
jgi:SAM-dependent methyltransferase